MNSQRSPKGTKKIKQSLEIYLQTADLDSFQLNSAKFQRTYHFYLPTNSTGP